MDTIEDGDFVRPRPAGKLHIARRIEGRLVTMACGKRWSTAVLDPVGEDHPNQCQACWDAM